MINGMVKGFPMANRFQAWGCGQGGHLDRVGSMWMG